MTRAAAPAFSISVAPGPHRADANRIVQLTFTIRNVSGRPLRCEARPTLFQGAARSWLAIQGEPVRQLADQASDQLEIVVSVPASVPPGSFSFRLDAVGLENPDEYAAIGPTVTFEVGPPLGKPAGKGYVLCLAGAVGGGLIGLIVGTLPGSLFLIGALAQHSGSSGNLGEAIGNAIATVLVAALLLVLGGIAGLWVGPVVGAWLTLRLRDYNARRATIGLLAVLLPVWGAIVWVGLILLFSHASSNLGWLVVVLGVALTLAVPPLAARALARLLTVHEL